MPPSDADYSGDTPPGQDLAVLAEGLYLANLMLIPGIAFVWLVLLYRRMTPDTPALAVAHLRQTLFATLWGGFLLVVVNLTIIALGGWDGPYTWVVVILYFTFCHACLILLGMMGLAKALAGRCWRFPLVGRPLPDGCNG